MRQRSFIRLNIKTPARALTRACDVLVMFIVWVLLLFVKWVLCPKITIIGH